MLLGRNLSIRVLIGSDYQVREDYDFFLHNTKLRKRGIECHRLFYLILSHFQKTLLLVRDA